MDRGEKHTTRTWNPTGILRVLTPCGFISGYQRFREKYLLHFQKLQPEDIVKAVAV
jgi:hypothetical protein